LKLEPGDVLVLYTDGITETVNADNSRLETRGLIKLIIKHCKKKIDAMKQAIIQDVLAWNVGRYVDDMTLVLIRRIH
jgi:sigma-B regulation protein RsbU (phosphoserine phosphatase)